MKPKLIHQQAMEYSFMAKKALEEGKDGSAFELYQKAARLESQVAEFYFDKPQLEPTRSVIIRSAAFMNMKAGLFEKALQFIYFGLLYTKDDLIKSQLNEALELAVSFRDLTPEVASGEFNYLNLLRQRSVNYIIEPANLSFGHSVSLEMIRDFSEKYLKSLRAYAKSKLKGLLDIRNDINESISKEFESLINPLVTSTSYGSFKLSIANDYQIKEGIPKNIVEFKSNVVLKYHTEIFINPLTDNDIKLLKENYSEDEVNEIFRPLAKIKSNNTPYKVSYYDSENLNKKNVNKIVNKQREKLLSVKQINQEDIGELENSIILTRVSLGGKLYKKTIYSEHQKASEFDIKTNLIEPIDHAPVLLNENILITVYFNSESGFRFSFSDFEIDITDTKYERGLSNFHTLFFNKIQNLLKSEVKSEQEVKDWEVIKNLIGNPDQLRK